MNYKAFKPAFGLSNRHIQTLYTTLFTKFLDVEMEVEQFELDDGDFLECYWHNKAKVNEVKPIVILFHGLAGSYKSPYIKDVMKSLGLEGFSVVLMHFRGCSGKENRLARSYHSGETLDAKSFLAYLQTANPNAPIFAVGYSLGGNMLLKMLGEFSKDSPLKACVSISAPMQLDICANQMDKGFSKFYQTHLLNDLKKALLQKYKIHDMKSLIGLDEEGVKKLKSFWEFDGAYTAPIHGFKSAKEYYAKSSAKQFLKDIQTNTLIIHALDDPFMTPEILPKEDEYSSKVRLEVFPHGGHVGFVGGTVFKPKFYLEDRIVNYFKHFL